MLGGHPALPALVEGARRRLALPAGCANNASVSAIVDNGLVPRSVAIDEDTVLVVDRGLRVLGTGSVWFSEPHAGAVRVTRRSAGAVDLPGWSGP